VNPLPGQSAGVRRCFLPLPKIPRDIRGVAVFALLLATVPLLLDADLVGLAMVAALVCGAWRLWKKVSEDGW
jgi:hypothetical protein